MVGSVTTLLAPLANSSVSVLVVESPSAFIPPEIAASMPWVLSSNTTQFHGA